jgi:hypothetical protein
MSKFKDNAAKSKPVSFLNNQPLLIKAIGLLRKLRREAPFKPSAAVPSPGVTRKQLRRYAPDKYALCPCKSGRRFKFCCWRKEYEGI